MLSLLPAFLVYMIDLGFMYKRGVVMSGVVSLTLGNSGFPF